MSDADLERQRLNVVLLTVGINVAVVSLLTLAPWSDWRTGLGLNLVDNALLIAHTIRRRDRVMLHLLIFGLVVGLLELSADAFLVDGTGTLDYSLGGGPMIWCSPIWMPLAWEVVTVQFGYLGIRLFEKFGASGLAMVGLLGALNIPFYEEMALHIHWWRYTNCKMFLHTPYYIIMGEFFIAVIIGFLAKHTRDTRWSETLIAGVIAGWSIIPAYLSAFVWIDAAGHILIAH
jgi:hypothetical protein